MTPKQTRVLAVVLGAFMAALGGIDAAMKSGQPLTWQSLVMGAGGALLTWVLGKRPGDLTPGQVDERVEEKLRAIATPPDDSTEF